MDFNYLYQRQQVSEFMAEHAQWLDVRRVHREFAQQYAARIAQAKLSRSNSESV